MTRPGLIAGVGVAGAGALGAGAAGWALALVLAPGLLARVVVGAVACGYGAWLYARGGRREGALTWAITALVMSAGAWLFAPGVFSFAAAHLAVLGALRAWLYAPTPLRALTDFGLLTAGALLALGVWLRTGSGALAVWVFLLTQAPFAQLGRGCRAAAPGSDFERAHRAAQDALRRAGAAP